MHRRILPMREPRRPPAREILGRAMSDFANSDDTTVIVTVVFGVIFPRLVVGDGPEPKSAEFFGFWGLFGQPASMAGLYQPRFGSGQNPSKPRARSRRPSGPDSAVRGGSTPSRTSCA